MPELKTYQKLTRPLPIPLGEGDPLTIHYYPAAMTPNLQKQLALLGPEDLDAMSKQIEPLLADWDFTDEGVKVPITVETLSSLGYGLLNDIITSIIEDIKPGANDPNAKRA